MSGRRDLWLCAPGVSDRGNTHLSTPTIAAVWPQPDRCGHRLYNPRGVRHARDQRNTATASAGSGGSSTQQSLWDPETHAVHDPHRRTPNAVRVAFHVLERFLAVISRAESLDSLTP